MTEPPDPVALAEADVRRLLPPGCGLQDPRPLRTRLSALLETLYRRVMAAEGERRAMKLHADDLDRGWDRHHSACMDALRDALGTPDASVPEMVARVRELEAARAGP